MKEAIETRDLVKRFGRVSAVDGVSLHVAAGEIYAFLGLNGAGKTTTVRMILGMAKPTAGEVCVSGTRVRPGRTQPWHQVGYLVETPHVYPELTVRENLEALRRLRPGVEDRAVDEVLERLGLALYAHRRAGTLSRGNMQRLGLAKALLHKPRILILDEPMNGLDPAGIVEVRRLLGALASEHGVTVFFSSHILGEVARLAHRIGIIHQGRLLQELHVSELERHRWRRLVVRSRDCRAACAVLRQAGYAAEVRAGEIIELTDESAISQPDVVATRLVHEGHPPTMLRVEEEDLEHYFLRLIGMEEGHSGNEPHAPSHPG